MYYNTIKTKKCFLLRHPAWKQNQPILKKNISKQVNSLYNAGISKQIRAHYSPKARTGHRIWCSKTKHAWNIIPYIILHARLVYRHCRV